MDLKLHLTIASQQTTSIMQLLFHFYDSSQVVFFPQKVLGQKTENFRHFGVAQIYWPHIWLKHTTFPHLNDINITSAAITAFIWPLQQLVVDFPSWLTRTSTNTAQYLLDYWYYISIRMFLYLPDLDNQQLMVVLPFLCACLFCCASIYLPRDWYHLNKQDRIGQSTCFNLLTPKARIRPTDADCIVFG